MHGVHAVRDVGTHFSGPAQLNTGKKVDKKSAKIMSVYWEKPKKKEPIATIFTEVRNSKVHD
jgi:hypothetical protein